MDHHRDRVRNPRDLDAEMLLFRALHACQDFQDIHGFALCHGPLEGDAGACEFRLRGHARGLDRLEGLLQADPEEFIDVAVLSRRLIVHG